MILFLCSVTQTQAGWWCVFLRFKSLSCFLTISAEIWSLNGKITPVVSSVSWDGDKSCCWSQTFESTILLMVKTKRQILSFVFTVLCFKKPHSSLWWHTVMVNYHSNIYLHVSCLQAVLVDLLMTINWSICSTTTDNNYDYTRTVKASYCTIIWRPLVAIVKFAIAPLAVVVAKSPMA